MDEVDKILQEALIIKDYTHPLTAIESQLLDLIIRMASQLKGVQDDIRRCNRDLKGIERRGRRLF